MKKKILALVLAVVMVAGSAISVSAAEGHDEGHATTTVPGKVATCTEKGLTDGVFCETCGKFVVNQKDIPAGHKNVVDVPGKAATCTEKGLTDGKYCKDCNSFVVNQKDVPAHEVVDVPGKAATCTEKGLTEGKYCKNCNKFVVNQKDVPASHDFKDGVCTVCGESADIATKPENTTKPEETTKTESTTKSENTTKAKSKTEKKENTEVKTAVVESVAKSNVPKTGDSASVMIYMIVAVAAVTGVVVARKRAR